MKKILLYIIILIPAFVFSQNLVIEPFDTLVATYTPDQFGADYMYVKNNSKNSMTIDYILLSNTLEKNGFEGTMCTSVGCYPNVPTKGTLGLILPSKKGFFNPHTGFMGKEGSAEIRLRVYERGNEANDDTLTFVFNSTMSTGIFSVNDKQKLTVYPNPAANEIHFKNIEIEDDIQAKIYNISGHLVLSKNMKENYINIEFLNSGQYFIHLINNNEIEFTTTFQKN